MAILVGVLVPNLLRYIERAKIAADIQLADSIRTTAIVLLADPDIGPVSGNLVYLTSNTGPYAGSGTNHMGSLNMAFETALVEALGYSDIATFVGPDGIVNEISQDSYHGLIHLHYKNNNEIGVNLVTFTKDMNVINSIWVPADFTP